MSVDTTLVFKPRPSKGWAWIGGLGLFTLVVTIGPLLAAPGGAENPAWFISLPLGLGIGIPMLVLAAWFPTMRYELEDRALTLRYGPVLRYRIPLDEIEEIRRRNLSISLWSSMRFPGLAIFEVPYSDVGRVKMCATAALSGILLIKTKKALYGMTPADEQGFVDALRARMEG